MKNKRILGKVVAMVILACVSTTVLGGCGKDKSSTKEDSAKANGISQVMPSYSVFVPNGWTKVTFDDFEDMIQVCKAESSNAIIDSTPTIQINISSKNAADDAAGTYIDSIKETYKGEDCDGRSISGIKFSGVKYSYSEAGHILYAAVKDGKHYQVELINITPEDAEAETILDSIKFSSDSDSTN